MMNKMIVCAQSHMNVARRPPKITYTAIPMGRRKHAATTFIPVKALTVAAPPTGVPFMMNTQKHKQDVHVRRSEPHTTRMQRNA